MRVFIKMLTAAGLLTHAVSLLIALWVLASMSSAALSWFYLWVAAPFVLPMVFAVQAVRGRPISWVMTITGTVSSVLGAVAYVSVFVAPNTDAQAGLVFVAIPLYQWVLLAIALLIHFLVKRHTPR